MDGEQYLIGFTDMVSGPAERAAAASRALTTQLTTVEKALASLDRQKTLAAAYGDIGKFRQVEQRMGMLSSETERLRAELAQVPAVASPASDGMAGVAESMGQIGGAATAAVAALGAVGTVAAGLAVWGASLAIDASDFKGDTIDALELVLETDAAAQTTYDRLAGIADHSTMTNADIQKRAFDLLAAGVHDGEQLDATIQSISDLVAVKGEAAAGKLDRIIERATTSGGFQVSAKMLQGTGVQMSVLTQNIADRTGQGFEVVAEQLKKGKVDVDVGIDAINAAIESKLGGFAVKQLNDLPVQMKRVRDEGKALFADIDTGPFLAGLATITSMLDQSTITGQALKELTQDVFQPMFDQATKLFPYVKVGFEEAIIVALELYIAMRPVREEWNRWLGTKGDIDGFERSMMGVGEAVKFTADWFVPLIMANVKLLEAMGAVANFVTGPYQGALAALGGNAQAADAPAHDMGKKFGDGFADGIASAVPGAQAAAAALADGAKDHVAKKLLIQSPSRVMMEMGSDTAEGFEIGLRDGAGDAHDAMDAMAVPPVPTRPAASSGQGGGTVVNVGGIQITISEQAASEGPGAMADEFITKLGAFFESLQLTAGA